MDELTRLHEDGVFLRREALDHGYQDRDLNAALRDGQLARIRHGAYVAAHVWTAADAVMRHRLKSYAVLRSHGNTVALSHTTGAIEHDLRVWQPDLSRVHVTRLDGGPGRTTHDIVYHEGLWTPDDIVLAGEDHLLMAPLRTALDAASLVGVEAGLVILDSLLDLDLAEHDELLAAYEGMHRWPRTQHLQMTVRLVRPGSQSAGESRTRFLCWSQRLPEPVLQFEVHDQWGNLVGVTDFAWPDHGVLGEFDGRVKYGRFLRPGETPGDAVMREKEREDLLRHLTGWLMIRIIWNDLYRPGVTAARIRSKMRRAA